MGHGTGNRELSAVWLPMVTQGDMSTWTWKLHKVPPVNEELQVINRCRERENQLSIEMRPPRNGLSSPKWSALNIYTYEHHDSESLIINEDVMNLRESLNET